MRSQEYTLSFDNGPAYSVPLTIVLLNDAEWSRFSKHSPAEVQMLFKHFPIVPMIEKCEENDELFQMWKVKTKYMSVFHEGLSEAVWRKMITQCAMMVSKQKEKKQWGAFDQKVDNALGVRGHMVYHNNMPAFSIN